MTETPPRDPESAAQRAPGISRKQFVIGFVSEAATLTSSWIGMFRDDKAEPQPVAILMRSRVAVFTETGHGGSKLVQTLRYGAECEATIGRRLTEFKHALPEYQYCIFGKITSMPDLAVAAKVLNIEIDPKLVRDLAIGEFLIWPAPAGVLRFRASQLGAGYSV